MVRPIYKADKDPSTPIRQATSALKCAVWMESTGCCRISIPAPCPSYPRNYVAPNGRVFGYDEKGYTYFLSPNLGSITFTGRLPLTAGNRLRSATSVMYATGKILNFGGRYQWFQYHRHKRSYANSHAIWDARQPAAVGKRHRPTRTARCSRPEAARGIAPSVGGERDSRVENRAEICDPEHTYVEGQGQRRRATAVSAPRRYCSRCHGAGRRGRCK